MRNKIYTKFGDKGETAVIGGHRVSKSDPLLEAYGSTDELNATIGCAVTEIKKVDRLTLLLSSLIAIQNQLFNIGSQLACTSTEMRASLPNITASDVQKLELAIDGLEESLPELREFILPGGSPSSAFLHLSRTICRRAERRVVLLNDPGHELIVQYLNRLGDYLFVAARYANAKSGIDDVKWQK